MTKIQNARAVKPERLKKRRDFLWAKKGQRFYTKLIVVESNMQQIAEKNQTDEKQDINSAPRIGFTVTKKCGNAVKRNRIKRRLRAAVDQIEDGFKCNQDYVIIAKPACLEADFTKIIDTIKYAIAKINVDHPSH